MSGAAAPTGVDDVVARLLVTPIVGVAIPNLAGMLNHSVHSPAGLAGTYAWFICVAYITWEGNLRLYLKFQDRTAWLTRPWHRVRLLIFLICLFTVPFTASALWGVTSVARAAAMLVLRILRMWLRVVFIEGDGSRDRLGDAN